MKHLLTLALALLFTLPVTAQSAEEAIKKVCLAETQAWLDADFNAWVATHAQHENETLAWTNEDGSNQHLIGWDNIYKVIKNAAATAQKSSGKLAADNFKTIVQGSMAFAMYDQSLTDAAGKVSRSREHRVLTLKDGQWKIVAVMAFYQLAEVKK